MTLADLHALAVLWCPPARWDGLLANFNHWGPAHEIGHALVSTPDERRRRDYGLPRRSWRYQSRHELAAMHISAALLTTAGRPDLVEREHRNTPLVLDMEEVAGTAAKRLILRLDLETLPQTRAGLERLLRRRLA